jgi:tetratricopeptide (TPR) repeat protein
MIRWTCSSQATSPISAHEAVLNAVDCSSASNNDCDSSELAGFPERSQGARQVTLELSAAETMARENVAAARRQFGRHAQTYRAYLNLAGIFAGQGKAEDAACLSSATVECVRHFFGDTSPEHMEVWCLLGRYFEFLKGDFREAFACYAESLRVVLQLRSKPPEHFSQICSGLAHCELEFDHLDGAKRWLEFAYEVSPTLAEHLHSHARLQNSLGIVHFHSDNLDDAARYFQVAHRALLDVPDGLRLPDSARAAFNSGLTLLALDERPKAEERFALAREVAYAANCDEVRDLADIRLGTMYFENEDFHAAKRFFTQVAARLESDAAKHPTYYGIAANNAAASSHAAGHYLMAETAYRKALDDLNAVLSEVSSQEEVNPIVLALKRNLTDCLSHRPSPRLLRIRDRPLVF